MSEETVPERHSNRSRSKTPFHLRSQCDGENCNEIGHTHSHATKNPNVSTIIEETSEQTTKQVQNSSESNNGISSLHKVQNLIHSSLSSTQPNTSSTVTKVTKTMSSQNNQQRTVLKSKRILNTTTEIKENILNKTHEDIRQANNKSTSNALLNVDMNDHLAFKEYKAAGEYWNKYPKTDYVYSSSYSPHRREIKPGVIAMPNMSRRSLDHHQERVIEKISHNVSKESFIQSRYQNSYENYADSQDEIDEYNHRRNINRYNEVKTSLVRRFLTTITTFFYAIWHIFRLTFSSETNLYQRQYHTKRASERKQGILSRISSSIVNVFLSVFRYIYLTIATIQFWDSCFLQSLNAGNRGKKRFLLLLLLLLPLLLLIGAFQYYEKPLPYPNISIESLPDYPNIYVYLNNIKNHTSIQYDNAKQISFDFLVYLKQLTGNYANEMKSLWIENFGS